jgi:hypothetical protein
VITIRNDSPAKRDFPYDACGLDGRNDEFLPSIIDRDVFFSALADKVESFTPPQHVPQPQSGEEPRQPSSADC